MVDLVVLACILMVTIKKVVNFFGGKVHPKRKSWLRLCLPRESGMGVR